MAKKKPHLITRLRQHVDVSTVEAGAAAARNESPTWSALARAFDELEEELEEDDVQAINAAAQELWDLAKLLDNAQRAISEWSDKQSDLDEEDQEELEEELEEAAEVALRAIEDLCDAEEEFAAAQPPAWVRELWD